MESLIQAKLMLLALLNSTMFDIFYLKHTQQVGVVFIELYATVP